MEAPVDLRRHELRRRADDVIIMARYRIGSFEAESPRPGAYSAERAAGAGEVQAGAGATLTPGPALRPRPAAHSSPGALWTVISVVGEATGSPAGVPLAGYSDKPSFPRRRSRGMRSGIAHLFAIAGRGGCRFAARSRTSSLNERGRGIVEDPGIGLCPGVDRGPGLDHLPGQVNAQVGVEGSVRSQPGDAPFR